MSSKSASLLAAIALPRTSSSATGSASPFLCAIMGDTLSAPAVRSMRSVSSTKLSRSVPICVSELQKSGSSGSRRGGTCESGSATSA